jgi:hypothetical protein
MIYLLPATLKMKMAIGDFKTKVNETIDELKHLVSAKMSEFEVTMVFAFVFLPHVNTFKLFVKQINVM